MPLGAGTRVGPYEIVAPLGAGGMGEVYRARDARLGRDVALKVLPDTFARDAERLARFRREAQVVASLNHPHIAAIHGLEESDGVQALVLELVEGPTLADRIAAGPLAVEDALPIARQIAEALEAAHDQGRSLMFAGFKSRWTILCAFIASAARDDARGRRRGCSGACGCRNRLVRAFPRAAARRRAGALPDSVYLGSLDAPSNEQSAIRLVASDSDPVYVAAPGMGSVLFLREGTLFVQPLDGRGQPVGGAVPIAEDIGNLGSHGWFSASATDSLVFRTGRYASAMTELAWFDRQGKRIGQIGPLGTPGRNSSVQISPDGQRVVVSRANSANELFQYRTWVAEINRGIFSRLNAAEGTENSPAVTPNGRVAFSSTLGGTVGDLYWMPVTGVGSPEPLLVKSPTVKHPNHVSPDGRFLLYDDHSLQARQDLWVLPLESAGDRKPIPFLVTQADETFGQFSPDGKWVAYSSDESGRYEVYVQGFAPDRVPAAAVGKWQISTAGGDKPRWRRDGTELYYIAPDRKMMAVPVKAGAMFEPGVAVPLFDTNVSGFFPYDVGIDGPFLLNSIIEAGPSSASPLTIVLNWQAGLKR